MTHRPGPATGILVLAVLATLAVSVPVAQAAPLETPVTEAATGVTATEATLHGELNPGTSSEEVEYHFTYNTGASCEGFNAPEPSGTASGNNEKVSQLVTGLTPNSEYTFCLLATSLGSQPETASSSTETFKTQSLAPAIDGGSTSNVSPIKATLEAQVNPNNEATTACTFEYGTTVVYDKTAPCEQGALEGFGDQTASLTATGLEPSTTYHFRVVVENATGTTEGADTEFTTPAMQAPLIDSESVSAIAPFSATLEAQINPDDQPSTFAFEYATNEALTGAIVVPGEFELSGFGDQIASAAIASLQRGTTYFFRAIAKNETGETIGPVQSFTTIGLPSVDDLAPTATNITHRQARLSGTVNPGGAETTFHFDYGPTIAYGSSTPESSAGGGAEDIAVGPRVIGELAPGTTYHFRLVATSAAGTSDGVDHTFTTAAALPPLVSTGGASSITSSSATISGTVDPQGLLSGYEFDLGIDSSYGSRIFGAVGEAAGTVRLGLSSLAPGTTYHYRLCAFNEDGTTCGADQTFATPGFPFGLTPGGASRPLIAFPAAILSELAGAEAHANAARAPKPLTRAQKRAKTLKACAKKPKRRQASCRRQVKRRYW